MFFYRDAVIQAQTKEELYNHSDCPICHNKLVPDWKMPLRYEPMALFRLLLIGGALAMLLSLVLIKLEAKGCLDFLNQFYYSTQRKLITAFLACICLPVSFYTVLAEIKLAHWVQGGTGVFGLSCPVCGNGYVGLVCDGDSDGVITCDETIDEI